MKKPIAILLIVALCFQVFNDLSETGDEVYIIKKTIEGLPIGIKEVG